MFVQKMPSKRREKEGSFGTMLTKLTSFLEDGRGKRGACIKSYIVKALGREQRFSNGWSG
jgi:hypothetical protein